MDKRISLNNNQLKIIAMIAMFIDHFGKELLPQYGIFSIIGRLAFPIFAYMLAEGAYYTRNRKKYIALIAGMAAACQAVYYFATRSLYMNILFTFAISLCIIYSIDYAKSKKSNSSAALLAAVLLLTVFVSLALPEIIGQDYEIDYGIFGILLPVWVYYSENKCGKLISAALLLIALALTSDYTQWFALLALPLLMLYNGRRGKANLKYVFYIFYPAHLSLIYLIGRII